MIRHGLPLSFALMLVWAVAAGAGSVTLMPRPAAAAETKLDGNWSGSGRVVLPSGKSERARCRVRFRLQLDGTYGMRAICSTASVRITQTGEVHRTSDSTYRGEFHNKEYDVWGKLMISVSGNRLSAELAGGGGTATFTLTR